MSIITSDVNIKKRYWESPSHQEKRHYEPYRWNGSVLTSDDEFKEVPIKFSAKFVKPSKPSYEFLCDFANSDGYSAKHYYLCEFQMSDFQLNGKVNIDMGCDETGKHFIIDIEELKRFSDCVNPLSNENDTFFIDRLEDGTLHLNTGFELLAELEERDYKGPVWAIVADNCGI